jgi:hypothetical protein
MQKLLKLRLIVPTILALAVAGTQAQTAAGNPAQGPTKADTPGPASDAKPDTETLSRMALKAEAAGVATCRNEVNTLSNYLYKDTDIYADVGVTSKVDPDRNVYYNISSQRFENANSINLMHAMPNNDKKCNSVLTQILPLPGESCLKVRETVAGDWKFLFDMAGVPIYEKKNDPTTTAIFMPMGLQGCLVIRSFVRYP